MTRELRQLISLFIFLIFAFSACAVSLPDGTMILSGSLAKSSDGKVIPSDGDVISIINVKTNQTESTTLYGTGSYAVILSKPASFNGTQIMLRISHVGTTYKLLKADGNDSVIQFTPGVGFFPSSVTMNLVISSAGGAESTTPATILTGDINSDGKINEADVQLLKQAISGAMPTDKVKMDVNADGVVNTRDLIDLIRAIRNQSQSTLAP